MAEEDFEHDFDEASEKQKDELSKEISNSYDRQKKSYPDQPKLNGDGET